MGDASIPPSSGEKSAESCPQKPSGSARGPPAGQVDQTRTKQEHASWPRQLPSSPVVAQHAFSCQLDVASLQQSYGLHGPYDMTPMVSALPAISYRPGQYPQGAQRYVHAASPPMLQQMPPLSSPYGGPPLTAMASQGYYVHQPHMPPHYYGAGHMTPAQAQPSMPARQDVAFYPTQMVMNHPQPAFYYPQANQFAGQPQNVAVGMIPGPYLASSSTNPMTADGSGGLLQFIRQGQDVGLDKEQEGLSTDSGSRYSAVRGPPRKPRQSGNMACHLDRKSSSADRLDESCSHVCRETIGLESLFLISKSNCAFANFKDEKICAAAQQRLHDSKFQAVRLVSRLRKNTVEGATGLTAPTGPAASTASATVQADSAHASAASETGSPSPAARQPAKSRAGSGADGNPGQDRFFILKSLTMEDLELSVRTGIWATQSHNEEALNNAFKKSDNVYLIFSANKSGEYFGYARMVSEINKDPAAAIEFAPKAQATSALDLPRAIPTDATEYAPKGRIIDDSSRGTIFWEAERDDSESGSDNNSEVSSNKSAGTEDDTKSWGKPFNLEWLSTSRLPFYRTRDLRNPWNSNREVKIARDGTELEPSVGRRLIGLFNRVHSPGPISTAGGPHTAMVHGIALAQVHGQ